MSPDAKDWIHTGVEVATALGVWGWIWTVGKRGRRVGKAIAHSPEMLHNHTEKEGVLTTAGIEHPFREGEG